MDHFQIDNFDRLPDSALISAKQLMLLSGRSRTSLWRDVLNEDLGGPVKIGARTVKWTAKEVRRYLRGGSKNDF